MNLLPIIERELRVALRKKRPVRRRLILASWCVGGSLLYLLLASVANDRYAGHSLHGILLLVGLFAVVQAPAATVGAFADERRDQTLELVFLSGLGAWEVFASKLLSTALIALADLLTIFPVLALPFLMGGVSIDSYLATIGCLPNLALFALAVSLLASVLTRDRGTAGILAMTIIIGLCAFTPAFYFAEGYFSGGTAMPQWWLRLSPAYGPWLIWAGFKSAPVAEFWKNAAVTFGWSGFCLCAAAFALKRVWREYEGTVRDSGWRRRWDELVRGDAGYRRRVAAVWLEVNPFAWLAARNRQPATLAWMVVGGIGLVWLFGCVLWPAAWPSVANFFITSTLLNASLQWIISHTAASSLGNARRDGSYEFLLTTPLQTTDIVWGQLEALQLQFRDVSRAVFFVNVVMMVAGFFVRPWEAASLTVYVLIAMALLVWSWGQTWNRRGTLMSMWVGLNCGRPSRALWKNKRFGTWWWIWMLFNLRNVGRLWSGFASFPTGSVVEIIMAVAILLILLAILLDAGKKQNPIEQRLAAEFREIVREPIPDPDDPRFKKWQPLERFPWTTVRTNRDVMRESVMRNLGRILGRILGRWIHAPRPRIARRRGPRLP